MKKNIIFAFAMASLLLMTSCDKKKQTDTIITKKQVPQKIDPTPHVIGDYNQSRSVEWVGATYQIVVNRKADSSLPVVDDGSGVKYYDNRIEVKVVRQDGSEFFHRSFTKSDFSRFVEPGYNANSVLLGVVFDKAEGDALYFAASVGSPDKLSDEYIPMIVTLTRMGDLSIKKGALFDNDNAPVENDDDGV